MRNIKWFATAAAAALILASAVVWSTSNTQAFVAAPIVRSIPFNS